MSCQRMLNECVTNLYWKSNLFEYEFECLIKARLKLIWIYLAESKTESEFMKLNLNLILRMANKMHNKHPIVKFFVKVCGTECIKNI